MFSFAVSALAAGFLESDIVSVYDRALQHNHGRATDCQAIWGTGSTVSDARLLLAQTARRFDPGQFDRQSARQVRESLLSVSAPHELKKSDPHANRGGELS